jgi:S1-C subfamily serine protease
VNLLDIVIVVAMSGAAYAGYRLGFVARAISWSGLAVGLGIAVLFVDDIVNALAREPANTRLVAALAFVVVLGTAGQGIGYVVGVAVAQRLPPHPRVRAGDRVGGALTGAIGVLIALWLLVPALTSSPGWTSREARDSGIVGLIDDAAPPPPDAAQALGRLVGDAPFPEVFDPLDAPADVGTPPAPGLSRSTTALVAASVVKVEGQACAQIQHGSGWVAADDLVVTNAHVVAGERDTLVETPDGRQLDADVVVFDPKRDLAVLSVAELDLEPLDTTAGEVGMSGAVFGHPGGDALHAAPARVAEIVEFRGTDIYRTSPTDREVFVLAAALAPGASGGPLVDREGLVAGVAFAIDPGERTTAYALTRSELDPVLAAGVQARDDESGAVETGSCLVG